MSLSFEQYLNIRYAAAPTFRADGGRMAFLTDIVGTAQIWTTDGPLQWPEQLTFYEDRVTFVDYSPTEPIIAFGKDSGGDEQQLIYIVSDEGGSPQRVSLRDAKHLWGGWSPDGQKMAWSHNGRNGRDFDVYVYDLATGTEERVVEADGYMWTVAWHPDGSGLFVGHATSNADSNIFWLAFGGGEPELLTEHDGDVLHYYLRPKGDGSTCFLATNGLGEFMNLATLDVGERSIEALEPAAEWDVEGIELSEDNHWLVIVRNVNGYSQATVVDLHSNTRRVVDRLPTGIIGGIKFVPGTSRFAVTLSGTADSTDIWLVDAPNLDVERWTRSSTGGVPRTSLVEPTLVSFHSFDDLEVTAFYWKPEGDGPFPVVVDIHGGPEAQRRPGLSALTQYYLQRGIATFAPNVRGSRGYGKTFMSLDDVRKRMHSVADIRAAYDWLITEGDAHPDKIAVKGGSYGGFMVLSAMVTYPDLWAAGVDIVGVANFVSFLENTSEYRRHLREAEYGSLEHDREFLHDISPLTHIHKIAAPLMVIHGRNDPRVPVSEAEQVVDACRANGLPVECIIYEDEGHGLAKRTNRLDAAPRVLDFLVEHLGLQ